MRMFQIALMWMVLLAAATLAAGAGDCDAEHAERGRAASSRRGPITWEQTASFAGTIITTTVQDADGQRVRQTGEREYDDTDVKPVYESFVTQSPVFRLTWEMTPSDRRGQIRVQLQKEVQRGTKKEWRRVVSVAPTRMNHKGEAIYQFGPGSYRLQMTGTTVSYAFTIEEAKRAE